MKLIMRWVLLLIAWTFCQKHKWLQEDAIHRIHNYMYYTLGLANLTWYKPTQSNPLE